MHCIQHIDNFNQAPDGTSSINNQEFLFHNDLDYPKARYTVRVLLHGFLGFSGFGDIFLLLTLVVKNDHKT